MKLFKYVIAITFSLASFISTAEVSVIVNSANNNDISSSQIKKIFLGKSKSFADGNKVEVYSLADGSNDTQVFRLNALSKSNSQYKSYWAKLAFTGKGTPPKSISDSEMISTVKSNSNAIGFINSDKVTGDVKVIATF